MVMNARPECRILLIDHPQFTHGTFFLWHGLKEIEEATGGAIQVSVYPHIPTHFDAERFNLLEIPWYQELEKLVAKKELPWGIPAFSPDETLTYHGQEVIGRYGFAQKFAPPEEPLREFEVVEAINQGRFDLIILGNSHRVPTILLGRLKEKVHAVNMPPIIYYDAGERDELNEHWVHVFRPDLTFKQIVTQQVQVTGLTCPIPNYKFKLLPLPLSSILVDYPMTKIGKLELWQYQQLSDPDEKFLDIFYPMGNTWDARQPILEMLDMITETQKINRIGPVVYNNFHLALAKSRMAVTMRGSGRDTLRYWEIPLYRTAMVSDGTMGCTHPYPFEDRKTALFWTDAADLLRLILPRLPKGGPHEAEIRAVAEAGKEHLRTYHSTLSRAMFFLDRLDEEFGFHCGSIPKIQHLKETRGWDLSRAWEGPVA